MALERYYWERGEGIDHKQTSRQTSNFRQDVVSEDNLENAIEGQKEKKKIKIKMWKLNGKWLT